jgi:hypothetical protein
MKPLTSGRPQEDGEQMVSIKAIRSNQAADKTKTKGQEESFRGNGYGYYLQVGGHACPNSASCIH